MLYSLSTWCVRLGWFFGGVFVAWSGVMIYRAAVLGILILFNFLWMRAAIRRAADAKFAEVLLMAEARRQ